MKRAMVAIVLMFALASVARAVTTFFSGNKLYEACSATDNRQLVCSGFVAATHDALQEFVEVKLYCPPTKAVLLQYTDIVKEWLRAHPEKRQWSASVAVTTALMEAWPCK